MAWPDPTPMEIPLPCFGTEHNKADPECQQCPHSVECLRYHGSRAGKVRLSKASFRFTPWKLEEQFRYDPEDPELPHVQRTYTDCYRTIFEKDPVDHVGFMATKLMEAARRCDCSLRLYMLAVMTGHRHGEKIKIERTEQGTPKKFAGKALLGKVAEKRAAMYAELCRKEFGTFTLSTLSTLADEDFNPDPLEQSVLHSEVVAAKFIINHKMFHGGPPWKELFAVEELTLNPYWLAIEDIYIKEVYTPYLDDRRGTDRVKQHRFSVSQVLGFMKKHKHAAMNAFRTRELIMPKAVAEVVTYFGHSVDDFEIEDTPVTEPLQFWVFISRAMQQWQCWQFLNGEPSLLDR
jgi:hypothetical protein